MRPINFACRSKGTILVAMTREPFKRPAEPAPAMARPVMKTKELLAAPQRREPISKMTNQTR